MTGEPPYRVELGVTCFTIAVHQPSRFPPWVMASIDGPGNLGRLPDDLAPDYQGYGFTTRRHAERACEWLIEKARMPA